MTGDETVLSVLLSVLAGLGFGVWQSNPGAGVVVVAVMLAVTFECYMWRKSREGGKG